MIGIVPIALLAGLYFYRTPASVRAPASDVTFGGVSLTLEYATTRAAREQGLSGRPAVPDGYGMLFVFKESGTYGFWMKDMLVPIDIFWLDAQGQVISITTDLATSTYPNVFYPVAPARYVLETAAGFARANGVATGTQLMLKNLPIVSE